MARKKPNTAQNVALGVTVVAAILLWLLLMGVRLHEVTDKPEHRSVEVALLENEAEQEETFVEPILQDAGTPDPVQEENMEGGATGEPDVAPEPKEKVSVSGKNPQPNQSAEKSVSTKNPSPAKTADPTPKEEPDSRVAATMKNRFSSQNGASKDAAGGTTSHPGSGSGASGTMGNGRKLESYEIPPLSITKRTVIKVEVMVAASGRVQAGSARVLSGGDASQQKTCRSYSEKTVWTKKEGAPLTRGVITWTLIPKL